MTNLMRQLDAVAKNEDARRIVRVAVWLGALCHLSAEHFTEHFERASEGTLVEGARLDITVSRDIENARAQDIVLESVEVET